MTREEAIKVLENEWKCVDLIENERKGIYSNNGTRCDGCCETCEFAMETELIKQAYDMAIEALSQPEVIRCKDCKHNPKDEWFGCPMAHLSEKQRPDDAWCWKGERRTDVDVIT